MPIGIVHWTDAVSDVFVGKAEIIETASDKFIGCGFDSFGNQRQFPMPAVIKVKDFAFPKFNVKFYRLFSRKTVYERDNGCCQYCGKKIPFDKMTFDHVIPKSKGGKTGWLNIVSCCRECNAKKSNKTLSECGFKLLKKPFAPIVSDSFAAGMNDRIYRYVSSGHIMDEWIPYVGAMAS